MKWFIIYMGYNSCFGAMTYPSNCSQGSYPVEMAMPSREVCEQVVKDNPNQSLKCWAKSTTEVK